MILQTQSLSKNYGSHSALQNFSMTAEAGEIIGIVGKNGAGKSTLMKCLLGLIPDYSGSVEIAGKRKGQELTREVGALVEQLGFFDNLSGWDNLRYFRKTYGFHDDHELEELLKKVRLWDERHKKFKKYSMGMRQRLGLALALMGDPKILVLDEPINGIDPQGIVEIRELLRHLAKEEGKTVLISSHILSELENLCDRFYVLDCGQLLRVLNRRAEGDLQVTIRLSTSDDKAAAELFRAKGWKVREERDLELSDDLSTGMLLRLLAEQQIEILEIEKSKETLEKVYLDLLQQAELGRVSA